MNFFKQTIRSLGAPAKRTAPYIGAVLYFVRAHPAALQMAFFLF